MCKQLASGLEHLPALRAGAPGRVGGVPLLLLHVRGRLHALRARGRPHGTSCVGATGHRAAKPGCGRCAPRCAPTYQRRRTRACAGLWRSERRAATDDTRRTECAPAGGSAAAPTSKRVVLRPSSEELSSRSFCFPRKQHTAHPRPREALASAAWSAANSLPYPQQLAFLLGRQTRRRGIELGQLLLHRELLEVLGSPGAARAVSEQPGAAPSRTSYQELASGDALDSQAAARRATVERVVLPAPPPARCARRELNRAGRHTRDGTLEEAAPGPRRTRSHWGSRSRARNPPGGTPWRRQSSSHLHSAATPPPVRARSPATPPRAAAWCTAAAAARTAACPRRAAPPGAAAAAAAPAPAPHRATRASTPPPPRPRLRGPLRRLHRRGAGATSLRPARVSPRTVSRPSCPRLKRRPSALCSTTTTRTGSRAKSRRTCSSITRSWPSRPLPSSLRPRRPSECNLRLHSSCSSVGGPQRRAPEGDEDCGGGALRVAEPRDIVAGIHHLLLGVPGVCIICVGRGWARHDARQTLGAAPATEYRTLWLQSWSPAPQGRARTRWPPAWRRPCTREPCPATTAAHAKAVSIDSRVRALSSLLPMETAWKAGKSIA
eukprot:scaffold685_cov324-Prasinococcus_capsulatus_cf.AAC.3